VSFTYRAQGHLRVLCRIVSGIHFKDKGLQLVVAYSSDANYSMTLEAVCVSKFAL